VTLPKGARAVGRTACLSRAAFVAVRVVGPGMGSVGGAIRAARCSARGLRLNATSMGMRWSHRVRHRGLVMAEHPGHVYMAAFCRKVERLAEIEKARKRPGSVWYERPDLWDGSSGAAESPSERPRERSDRSGSGSRMSVRS
jgi:hypothetical protein